MTYTFQNPSQDVMFDYLKNAKTIAVVGLSDRQETAAYRVSKLMQEAAYTIIPVNPKLAGQEILGQKVYACLQDIPVHVDIVNVFRRSEFLPDVASDFLETDADIFWAQLGLESQEAEEILRQTGRNDIVMNKCIKVEYLSMVETWLSFSDAESFIVIWRKADTLSLSASRTPVERNLVPFISNLEEPNLSPNCKVNWRPLVFISRLK